MSFIQNSSEITAFFESFTMPIVDNGWEFNGKYIIEAKDKSKYSHRISSNLTDQIINEFLFTPQIDI